MYSAIKIKDSTTAKIALLLISRDMLALTFCELTIQSERKVPLSGVC